MNHTPPQKLSGREIINNLFKIVECDICKRAFPYNLVFIHAKDTVCYECHTQSIQQKGKKQKGKKQKKKPDKIEILDGDPPKNKLSNKKRRLLF
jgi:hypothetical protein